MDQTNNTPEKNAEIRIGIFGASRGGHYYNLLTANPHVEVVAVCDKNPDETRRIEGLGTPAYRTFDEFLEKGRADGMNAVFLCNYFHQHAPYAIRAMEAGMDVVSECTAAGTLKECVELVEAVERTGRRYFLAENYPFIPGLMKMGEIMNSGKLGSLLYAEGEYNHSSGPEGTRQLAPMDWHWRLWRPRTYYITHSLGPVMYLSGSEPRYVSGRAAHSDLIYGQRDFRHNYDGAGMIFCEMTNGMMARCTGCTEMAAEHTRYRVCGDVAALEYGDHVGGVRMIYTDEAAPAGHDRAYDVPVEFEDEEMKRKVALAQDAGHGGADYFVVETMVDYFLHDVKPFFDVYRGVSMSAAAILGWISALNHGENMLVPDFRIKEERDRVRDDDRTPFPDENLQGITLPCALPFWPGKPED